MELSRSSIRLHVIQGKKFRPNLSPLGEPMRSSRCPRVRRESQDYFANARDSTGYKPGLSEHQSLNQVIEWLPVRPHRFILSAMIAGVLFQ
jgi:hypothetical protein